MNPYLLDTNIFNRLIRKKDFAQKFQEYSERCNFPNLDSLYFTPFCVIEYLGIKLEHPKILPPKLKKNEIDNYLDETIAKIYSFYKNQKSLDYQLITERVNNVEAYVINETGGYFNNFKSYIKNDFSKEILAYHLTTDFIYNFPFQPEIRREVFVKLSLDILRNIHVPFEVSKFRLVQNDWDTHWTRLKKESNGNLSKFDSAIRLKSKGDFLDSDIVHLTTMGINSNHETVPLVAVTSDNFEDVIGRVSLYKALVRFLKHFYASENVSNHFITVKNSNGIIFFTDDSGKFIGKATVEEIPIFGKDPND